jgi:hypothetical protein
MGTKTHGIASTDDGSFRLVSLEKTASGWRCASTRRWNADSRLKNALLLHRGVRAALPCRWKRSGDGPAVIPDQCVSGEAKGAFVPFAGDAAVTAFSQRLAANLVAVVCDDAFLCTIPLALKGGETASFLSVYRAANVYKIGIIAERTLTAVFSMAPAGPGALEGHLGRIRRYWREAGNGAELPSCLYVFGDVDASGADEEAFAVTRLDCGPLGIDIADRDTLTAAGAALSGITGFAPRFLTPHAAQRAALRGLRTALYAASAALVVMSLLLAAALSVQSVFAHRGLDGLHREYRDILSRTPEIQPLMAQNDSLARAAIAAFSADARRTHWVRLLQFLGTEKPDGLFFDMLGTDPGNEKGTARIALSGWAYGESLVTGFIASLQKSGLCSSVTLSSIEKSQEPNNARNVFSFRIVCSLQLVAGSPAK